MANFKRPVLGCIEADDLQVNIRFEILDEIYKIYKCLHRSESKKAAKFRKTEHFRTFADVLPKFHLWFAIAVQNSQMLIEIPEDLLVSSAILTEKSKSLSFFSNFLRFRNK